VIRAERIQRDIEAIARLTQAPGAGADRPTFSTPWAEAVDYVAVEARKIGCDIRMDAAGNLHARPHHLGWDRPAWLCGSHLDSVPNGGDYDGVAGVIVGLELLRSAAEDSIALTLELIVFAEEEGTTFGLGMLGSRTWVGELAEKELLAIQNAAGQNYLEAGAPFGVDAPRLAEQRIVPEHYLGLIEIHIEQGPGMWQRGQRIAIVQSIAGRIQYRAVIEGQANHAGATRMEDRRDALAGTAEIMLELERLAKNLGAVITVGRLANHPNAINVIPDRVEFTIDLRAGDDTTIARADQTLRKTIAGICSARQLQYQLESTESIPACPMDAKLCDRLARAAALAGNGTPRMTVSGALHDSAVVAKYIPTAMLFVPSRDGISHNPAEFSRIEDIAAAAAVVEQLVRRPTLDQLNELDQRQFVSICGGLFEHSPWIAERAWKSHPFASPGDLHEKLTAVLAQASAEEKLALVRAHPDLVGRLAREGKVTRESSNEQAAAGLTALNSEQTAAFERYNQQYREKFGFPFVICARQNRKEAILHAMPRRLANDRDTELAAALAEICKIAQLRLADAIWET
jgi:allantoate deiminase